MKRRKTNETKYNRIEISPKMKRAAEMLVNPEQSLTVTEMCKILNVARSTFYRWLEKEEYREYLDHLIGLYTDGELSQVWHCLFQRIKAGDTAAIKLYFELKGKYKQDVQVSMSPVQIIDDFEETGEERKRVGSGAG